ncbi:hypothetical protein [Synechococcus sp. UW105]|uniref:hypothetical protein n=1 Tax=Synechococcus sp. UW105 TaxID=337067 RepID=UPI0010BE17E3|nr:hypothetical protein [Synechococcus sp. UW105]
MSILFLSSIYCFILTVFYKPLYFYGFFLILASLFISNNFSVSLAIPIKKYCIGILLIIVYFSARFFFVDSSLYSEIIILRQYFAWFFVLFLVDFAAASLELYYPSKSNFFPKLFLSMLFVVFALLLLEWFYPSFPLFTSMLKESSRLITGSTQLLSARVYGLTGRPSTTGSLLVVLFVSITQSFSYLKNKPYLSFISFAIFCIAFILIASGTAAGLVLASLIFYYILVPYYQFPIYLAKRLKFSTTFLVILVIFSLILFLFFTYAEYIFPMFSLRYISYLFVDHKIWRLSLVFSSEHPLLGYTHSVLDHVGFGSDFGYLEIYYYLGFIGSVLLGILLISISPSFTTVLFLLASLHYNLLFTSAGSVVFALTAIISSRYYHSINPRTIGPAYD